MNLIDTNIILELLLEREKAKSVYEFFQKIQSSEIFISDFSIHSIGILLLKLGMSDILTQFINDTIIFGGIQVVSLKPNELIDVIKIANQFNLDFDDAYQYVVAQKYNLQIISFDKDFDRTTRKRKEPSEVIL